jgi:hypothetical protein
MKANIKFANLKTSAYMIKKKRGKNPSIVDEAIQYITNFHLKKMKKTQDSTMLTFETKVAIGVQLGHNKQSKARQ